MACSLVAHPERLSPQGRCQEQGRVRSRSSYSETGSAVIQCIELVLWFRVVECTYVPMMRSNACSNMYTYIETFSESCSALLQAFRNLNVLLIHGLARNEAGISQTQAGALDSSPSHSLRITSLADLMQAFLKTESAPRLVVAPVSRIRQLALDGSR